MSGRTLLSRMRSKIFSRVAKAHVGVIIRNLLKEFGFVLMDKRKFMNLKDISQFLAARNVQVSTVYDIGAYVGEWSVKAKSIFGPDLRAYMFEPNLIHNGKLADLGEPFYNEVLSDSDASIDFFSVGGTGDSMFRENTSIYQNVQPIKRNAIQLDVFVEKNAIALPQIIKIDVQGAELKVVNGARRVITQASVVIIECQMFDRNIGGSKISDVLQTMNDLNFAPVAISEVHQELGVIQEIDFVFVSKALLR